MHGQGLAIGIGKHDQHGPGRVGQIGRGLHLPVGNVVDLEQIGETAGGRHDRSRITQDAHGIGQGHAAGISAASGVG